MEDVIKFILQNIISNTEALSIIKEDITENEVVFKIVIADEDKGIVIGKGGRNIQSIRNLINIVAKKEGKKAFIKIEE